MRGDTAFSLTKRFDRWAKEIDFLFGMDANAAMPRRTEELDETAWSSLETQAQIPDAE